LEEMAWNRQLNKWTELQRVESFPCKWCAFRHRSKVLGNQWESFQQSSTYFQWEATDYGKSAEALWEPGHQDCEREPALMAPYTEGLVPLACHAKSLTATNSSQFLQRIITLKYSMVFTPFPALDILGLLQIVLC